MPWYRIVNPEADLEILRKRKAGEDCILSAFQYLRSGVPQSYFAVMGEENGLVGITLKGKNDRLVLWRNGSYCGVSDHIFKRGLSKANLEKTLKENDYITCSELDVKQSLEARYKKNYDEAVKEGYKGEKDRESYAQLAWSEGVFKYSFSDIDSIVIDPKNVKSIAKGYAFSKAIEREVGRKIEFVCKDEGGKGVIALDREKIKKFVLDGGETHKSVLKLFDKYAAIIDGPSKAPTFPKADKAQAADKSKGPTKK